VPKFTPYVTHVVDPVGVDTSIEPRPMEMGSDQSRESVVPKLVGNLWWISRVEPIPI